MPPVQESRERRLLFAPPRVALPVEGPRSGVLKRLREGPGCFLLFFASIGAGLFLFGLAGTFGPWRDALRENGDPRFFLAAMGFGTVFVLVPLRMLQVVLTGAEHADRRRKARVDPTQPWASDYPWRPDSMAPEGEGGAGEAVLGRVAFLALIGLFNLGLASGSWLLITIIVILDLLGLVILYDSIHKLWMALRYPRPRISWLTFPVFTGSRLEAVFRSRRRLQATGPARVTLRCVRDEWEARPTAKGGQSHQLEAFMIYEQVTEIPIESPPIDSLRIEIDIPADLPGTDLTKEEAVYWQVVVQIPVLGPDFESVFLAPVYRSKRQRSR